MISAIARAPWLSAAAAVVAVLFAAPLVYLVVRSASERGAFLSALSTGSLGPLGRSLLLASSASAACAVIGTGAAWAITRTDLPGRRVFRLLLPLPLVIPSFIGAFALLAAFAPGGLLEETFGVGWLPAVDGFPGAFAVITLLSYPFVFLPVAARLAHLDRSLEESAQLLGRRPLAVFAHVVLPQARSAIVAGALLVFLYALSDFGVVQLLRYDTLTRAIYASRLLDPPLSLTLSLELGLLALAVVGLERLAARKGARRDLRRLRDPLVVPLRRWRWPAAGLVTLLVSLALAAPVAVLVVWAVRGLVRGSTRASALVSNAGDLVGPALNTTLVSVVAAAAAVALVVPIAYLAVRRRSRVGTLASALVVGGFALPGLVIALSLVFWTLDAPGPIGALYQTLPLLVFAYVVHFGAQSMGTAEVAVSSIPRQLDEAALALGARRARRFLRVELPLMTPTLLAGAGLVMLSTMKELPATLLLAPPGFQTLATKIWTATEDAFLADASLAALVLVALSGVLTWLLVVRRAAAL